MDQHNLTQRLAELARDLRSAPGHDATLQHVVEASLELVGPCDTAGVSLARRHHQIETAASTDDLPRLADELQLKFREGPCLEAAWESSVVRSDDLLTEQRWASWGPRAAEDLGVRSLLSFRLATHEDLVGSLTLYSRTPGAFSDEDVEEGEAIAAHAAVALVAAAKLEGLDTALVNRTVIGQATGIAMQRYGLTPDQAFAVLRRLSNEQNRKLVVIATEMVQEHVGAEVPEEAPGPHHAARNVRHAPPAHGAGSPH